MSEPELTRRLFTPLAIVLAVAALAVLVVGIEPSSQTSSSLEVPMSYLSSANLNNHNYEQKDF